MKSKKADASIIERFKSFGILAILLAGLMEGIESMCISYSRLFHLLSHHGGPDTKRDLLGRNGFYRGGLCHPFIAWPWNSGFHSASFISTPLLPNRLFNHFCLFPIPWDLQPLRLCPTQERPTLQDDTSGAEFFKEEDSPDHPDKRG